MKTKEKSRVGELRMDAKAFDNVMRKALGVNPKHAIKAHARKKQPRK